MTDQNKEIYAHMNQMRAKYLQENGLITDKDCIKLSFLLCGNYSGPADIEAMAVQRGIIQGMQLLRQIIEGYNLETPVT